MIRMGSYPRSPIPRCDHCRAPRRRSSLDFPTWCCSNRWTCSRPVPNSPCRLPLCQCYLQNVFRFIQDRPYFKENSISFASKSRGQRVIEIRYRVLPIAARESLFRFAV